jgi:hypothetical protein
MRFRGLLSRVLVAGALLAAPLVVGTTPAAEATGWGADRPATLDAPATSATTAGSIGSPALSAWRGGIDLYRAGTFTTQKTWLWCTAADIQITRNIVFGQHDHSFAGQQAYFDWMRAHNRYHLPLSAGVDAQGWTLGFDHFVDARYKLFASSSFDAALRSAVTNLRRTNLPVGITVNHGNHAWLITGFTATADPAATTRFTVTSVRVVGPLYGLQSRGGYDMPPDTRLTPSQLRAFFTPWYYAPTRMVWDGRYVSMQPVATTTAAQATPTPAATRTATPKATAVPAATDAPTPTIAPAPSPDRSESPSLASVAGPARSPSAPDQSDAALAMVAATASPVGGRSSASTPADLSSAGLEVAVGALIAAIVAVAVGAAWTPSRRR